MPLRILIAPDKFKGTLAARPVAEAIARGWSRARPEDVLELLPISDGGDGFGELLGELLHAAPQTLRTVDAAHRPLQSLWWWQAETRTAIVESARCIGLALLPPGQFHPFELDTRGLGAIFQAALALGARRCLVGIGGSATNDGGFGLARALGWQFFDASGAPIERWTGLHRLASTRLLSQADLFEECTVAVDVQNPLLGPQGCTRVYGPQKGLRPEDFDLADRCLRRLAEVMRREGEPDVANEPGSGAAGGLGFGLRRFAGARVEPGFGLFARHARLKERLVRSDLVVTGEGAMDEQTLMGKGVGELAQHCRQAGVPCLALAGVVHSELEWSPLFCGVHALTPRWFSKEIALGDTAICLAQLAALVAGEWKPR